MSPTMCFPEQANRPAEPWWFRENLLPDLDLPVDLPVHFIGEKAVTASDFDQRQSRICLPAYGVMRNLRPILTAEELLPANVRYEDDDDHDVPTKGGIRKKRKRGGRGRGLPVQVVDTHAEIIELQMSRRESCPGATIKGHGYMGFVTECSFSIGDSVQIWAFKPHASSFSPLYLHRQETLSYP